MAKKKEETIFYFEDTRENAKDAAKFGITNADAAKSYTRDYNNGEGPFKPVKADPEEFQINRRDLQEADLNETPAQIVAMEHNMEVLGAEEAESLYADMTKEQLQDELSARGLEFKKSGKESTNSAYIKALMADDSK